MIKERGALSLTEADHRNLETRWIDPPLIERARLYRVNSSDGAALVGRNGAGNYAGLAIPNIFPGHDRARDYTLRLDHPELELRSDGTTRPKARYLNPPGRGNRLYMPPGTPAPWLQETSLPMVVVEGPFKALAVWRLAHHGVETPRWLCVGVNGCWGWRGTVGKTTGPDGDRRDVKGTIVDLNRISCEGRPVYLVADTNITTNSSVAAGWREFGNELEGRGANVVMVEVPAELGINGVDDFLARHGPKAGLALFEAAKPRNASRDFHLTDLGNA